MIKRLGMKCIKIFKKDEVVAMCNFGKKLFIATKKGVYIYPSK